MSDATSPRTLELRIHGVNNTTPANMLGLRDDQIERIVGDELGGFWRAKPDVLDRLAPGDRGYTPPNVVREAYSWGGLARNSVGVTGRGVIPAISRALTRVGWVLLLPLGLCNVAYWSRRLDTGIDRAQRSGVPARSSACMTRWFGLGLTLLFVFTMCELAMDLVASQCYGDATVGNAQLCENLPSWFDVLRQDLAVRLVIASVVPLALLGGLYFLSSVSRTRFERATSDAYQDLVAEQPDGQGPGPVISTPGFWSGHRLATSLARLHIAAGFSAVTLALAAPAMLGGGEACDIRRFGSDPSACWDQITDNSGRSWTYGPLLALALILMALIVFSLARLGAGAEPGGAGEGAADSQDRSTLPLVVISVLLLVTTEALVGILKPSISSDIGLPGVNAAPTWLAMALTAIAWGALTWRFDKWTYAWSLLIFLGLVMLVISRWDGWAILVGVGALAVFAKVFVFRRSGARDRRVNAWAGSGPGILLGGSLIAALTLSSLLILVTGDWLNGNNNASTLIEDNCPTPVPTDVAAHPCLEVPTAYVWFGGALVVALIIMVLVLAIVLVTTARGRSLGPGTEPAPEQDSAVSQLEQSLRATRRWAGRAHRAEKLIAVLVSLGMVVILLMLTLTLAEWVPSFGRESLAWPEEVAKWAVSRGTLAFAFVGLVLVGAAIGGGEGRQRPLGLIWDLVCFLPRAAHPFAPACYAERAVPEIMGRCDWWLHAPQETTPEGRRGDTIVLSAHSLGSVLAVASLFSMTKPATIEAGPTTYRLITYGSQLRAYFGRIFPELLGPQVLGTTPVTSARLWSTDPWRDEVGVAASDLDPNVDSLVNRLRDVPTNRPRWRNLWRRTDYLGFPVHAYQPNVIDVRASELDETGYQIVIGTHSDYPNTREYGEVLALFTR